MQRRASSWLGAVMAPVGQAGMHARAGAAVRARGFIDGQRQVGEDLADEEVRAGVARDEIGVFAYPPEPGVARQRLLEHRPRVDEHAVTHRPDALDDVVGQALQGVAQHLVIVAAQRVSRDVAQLRIGQRLGGIARIRRPVVHARRQHAHRARHQLLGARAARAVFGHVAHLAVFARAEPAVEVRGIDGELARR